MEKAHIKLALAKENLIHVSMHIEQYPMEKSISDGAYYKILISKSNVEAKTKLLAKIMIPKDRFELKMNGTFTMDNLMVQYKRSKGKIHCNINYQNTIPITALTPNKGSWTITVVDKKVGIQHEFVPTKKYGKGLKKAIENLEKKLAAKPVVPEPKRKEPIQKKQLSPRKPLRPSPERNRAMEQAAQINKNASEGLTISSTTKTPTIRTARDTAFKRCDNCLNFGPKSYCVKHKQTVSRNNTCNSFYTHKVYLGGAFSPR